MKQERGYPTTGEVDNDRVMSILIAARLIEGVESAYIGLSKDNYHPCLFVNGVRKGERALCITITKDNAYDGKVLELVRAKMGQLNGN